MPNSEKLCEVTELEIFGLLGCLLWTGMKKHVDKTQYLFLRPFASWPFKLMERTMQGKQTAYFLKKRFRIADSCVPNLKTKT